jgi:hypothetical protein
MYRGKHSENGGWSRRRFLHTTGSLAALASAEVNSVAAVGKRGVSLVTDPADPIASSPESLWAAKELEDALKAHGVSVLRCERTAQANSDDLCLVVAGLNSPLAVDVLKNTKMKIAAAPEALGVLSGTVANRKVILACGYDSRAVMYALLDLADRVQNASSDPIAALENVPKIAERPANQVRSITRLFVSDIHDKPWYNDREMWPDYLTMLATQRFNRFNLAFGIGYDFIRHVTDAYFLFTYPFLLNVPGYNVRVPQLPDAERDHNLEMLRYISEQTVARGLEFHVGLWMHGYEWINSPNANYTVEGLTKETHGAYCRDAVRMLLKACPAISGVTFRIHGESGVQEGSYDFWKMVFEGVATCGRTVKLDMHTKGMDQTMTDIALATKLPVNMSPKFWGEHQGMTYHQADIREMEQPKPGDENKTGLMKLSAGARSFLRYGYGDLLREDRQWTVVHRIWPGTQRLLLWGDPVTAAGYSRCFSFCGSIGVEICEPLSFKGRRGSGLPGGRCAYADVTLNPKWDWQKYEYAYRTWGRLLYNPDAEADTWQRALRQNFGAGAADLETSLANASRILPTITTAHAPSAGNNTYWPELYWNQSFVDGDHFGPYGDSPAPKVFGNASPFDPQLFSRMNDFAAELLGADRSGKYSPIEVAQWIEDYAEQALKSLKRAEAVSIGKTGPEYRRLTIDIAIQAALGQFFGAKFRSGVLFGIYEKSGDRSALTASVDMYRKARLHWAQVIEVSKGVYMADITVGEEPQQRGNWADRLPSMDKDIAAVAQKLEAAPSGSPQPKVAGAIQEALGRPQRRASAIQHIPAATFQPGRPMEIAVSLSQQTQASSIRLYYRHVDQAERWVPAPMQASGQQFRATIPALYMDSEYPLEYYFEVKDKAAKTSLYPGFSTTLTNQPYFVVRRA